VNAWGEAEIELTYLRHRQLEDEPVMYLQLMLLLQVAFHCNPSQDTEHSEHLFVAAFEAKLKLKEAVKYMIMYFTAFIMPKHLLSRLFCYS